MSTTTEATTTYYTTLGDVRGCCGHRHTSVRTAADCLARDRSGCRSQGGYSDRHIVRVPDNTAPGDLAADRVARAPEDVTMGGYVERPQWVGYYDLPEAAR